ncbi:hypothetical protein HPP92_014931 [Vanilla planifolia]|uniref:Uncharacterized protein n=1 Tax=Vanilla planifolia TaxID=51239 RepID=A0A835QI90_VANPL|nr:hypothetical protein HPP92_014931 [Vanilla planifolia]
MKPPSFSRISGLLPSSDITTAMTNTQNNDTIDSFVKAQLLIYSNGSPYYHNLDNRVVITLATLSFYCYRPTILAILEFVDAINVMENAPTENDSKSPMPNVSTANFNSVEDGPTSYIIDEPVAKGFLSNGKTRIIFFLSLNMATAQIFLMNEDETSLATLSQNNLVADIKVFSSSFSIKAALGNLKISDDTLPRSHSYYWACDMRNPEGSSFVKLDFSSFSENDEDYNGYDYSLTGNLSEVRIVYLNRFVQEVTSYFMGLVPRNSETFVKLKDHGTNSEKQFPTSEIQGSPALKLDLLLSRPIILMPKRTQSADYLKLDAKHITVQNTFRWLGGDKNEISAVRLDIMTVKVEDINLTVGTGRISGESIIQDVSGLSVTLQRSLRDLLHQVPATEAIIQINAIKAALSNKEYEIITECAISNISEIPRMARGAWILYKSNLRGDGFLFATLKGFSVIDVREGIKEELRLAIGKSWGTESTFSSDASDTLRLTRPGEKNVLCELNSQSIPSMLILDATFKNSLTNISLCVQRPKLLVVLDFLLAISEFFVPSLRSVLSDEEEILPLPLSNAVIIDQQIYFQPSVVFSLSPLRPLLVDDAKFEHFIYDGKGGKLFLQSRDGRNISKFNTQIIIHVGDGKRLQFKNVTIVNGHCLDNCVFLGSNSSYSASEDDKVYFKEMEEDVPLVTSEDRRDDVAALLLLLMGQLNLLLNCRLEMKHQDSTTWVAIGPELTFYNASKKLVDPLLHPIRLSMPILMRFAGALVSPLNILAYSIGHGWAKGQEKRSSLRLRVLPNLVHLRFSMAPVSSRTSWFLSWIGASCCFMETISVCFKGLDAINSRPVAEPWARAVLEGRAWASVDCCWMETTGAFCRVSCSWLQWGRVGTGTTCCWLGAEARARPELEGGAGPGTGNLRDQKVYFLEDLSTIWICCAGNEPPAKGVLAVNTSFAKVKRPTSYRLISSFGLENAARKDFFSILPSEDDDSVNDCCSVWFPVAPKGYVAVGCVVSPGSRPPSLSSALCILSSLVTPCTLKDCIAFQMADLNGHANDIAFWRVDNSFGSFLPASSDMSVDGRAYEFRHMILDYLSSLQ